MLDDINLSRIGVEPKPWQRAVWLVPKLRAFCPRDKGVLQEEFNCHLPPSRNGRLQGQVSAVNPKRAIDLVGSMKAPLLGLYGGQDDGVPLPRWRRCSGRWPLAALAARRSKFVVFPDAPHAFHADYRRSYRKAAAEEGGTQALDWFQTHGVA